MGKQVWFCETCQRVGCAKLEREADDDLLQLYELSTHQFHRVSFLQFTVQSELQQIAKMHNVLLSISVLSDQEGETHA